LSAGRQERFHDGGDKLFADLMLWTLFLPLSDTFCVRLAWSRGDGGGGAGANNLEANMAKSHPNGWASDRSVGVIEACVDSGDVVAGGGDGGGTLSGSGGAAEGRTRTILTWGTAGVVIQYFNL
jgi:hypothetical protein